RAVAAPGLGAGPPRLRRDRGRVRRHRRGRRHRADDGRDHPRRDGARGGADPGARERRHPRARPGARAALQAAVTLHGMIGGMTTAKIAISVPRDILQRARRAVRRGRAASMSAYVVAAMAQKATLDELDDLLVEMLAETGGPLTAAEARSADAA